MADKIAQKTHIKPIELCNPAANFRQKGGGLFLRFFQLLAADLFLVQQHVAEKWHQRQSDDERGEDQRGDGEAEVPEHHARQPRYQPQGNEHRQSGEGGGQHGGGDLLCAVHAGAHTVMALGSKAVDILQHHDGVVHDHAHAHGHAAQGHHIQRQVHGIHQDEHRQNTNGHGHYDGHGGAAPAQEQKNHNGGQQHALEDILKGGADRHVNVLRSAVRHAVNNGGVFLLQLCQASLHGLGGGGLIGAGLLGDLENDAGGAVHLGGGVGELRLQRYVRHLAEAHRAAGGQGQKHIRHVLHRLELGVGADSQGLGPVLHAAAGIEQVLGRQELGDLGCGQPQAGGPCGVQLHGDLLRHTAVDGHLGHAVNALQSRGHRILRQGLQLCQVAAGQGHHGRGHQLAEVQVHDDGIYGVFRQAQPVKLFPQLGGGDVKVRALHIGDLELAHAVGGGGGHLVHAGDRHDGGLQRPGDELLDIAGVGAVVIADHHGHGGLHLRHQGHLQLSGEDQAENRNHDNGQKRCHLVLDAEF